MLDLGPIFAAHGDCRAILPPTMLKPAARSIGKTPTPAIARHSRWNFRSARIANCSGVRR
jgi:hypothetical protein